MPKGQLEYFDQSNNKYLSIAEIALQGGLLLAKSGRLDDILRAL